MQQAALITGASSGIGAGLARALHRAGYAVTLIARRADRLEALATELNATRAKSAFPLACDLTLPAERAGVLSSLADTTFSVVVNNAGFGSFGEFAGQPRDRELDMVRLNIEAVLDIAHRALPKMIANRSGTIVIISSIASFQPLPLMATYAATKAFERHFADALREELRPHGIQVLTICPGPTATEFAIASNMPGQFASLPGSSCEDVVVATMAGLTGGASQVIPGLAAKLYALPGRLLPQRLCARIAGWAMRRRARSR